MTLPFLWSFAPPVFKSDVRGLVLNVKHDIYLYNQRTSIITFYTLVLS
jgi:hypothetical protein